MKAWQLIKSKISEWSIDKLLNVASKLGGGMLGLTDALFPIFIVISIIGILITMSGQRKLGTKISSLSFITYIFLRVVAMAYV